MSACHDYGKSRISNQFTSSAINRALVMELQKKKELLRVVYWQWMNVARKLYRRLIKQVI